MVKLFHSGMPPWIDNNHKKISMAGQPTVTLGESFEVTLSLSTAVYSTNSVKLFQSTSMYTVPSDIRNLIPVLTNETCHSKWMSSPRISQ